MGRGFFVGIFVHWMGKLMGSGRSVVDVDGYRLSGEEEMAKGYYIAIGGTLGLALLLGTLLWGSVQ